MWFGLNQAYFTWQVTLTTASGFQVATAADRVQRKCERESLSSGSDSPELVNFEIKARRGCPSQQIVSSWLRRTRSPPPQNTAPQAKIARRYLWPFAHMQIHTTLHTHTPISTTCFDFSTFQAQYWYFHIPGFHPYVAVVFNSCHPTSQE